MLPGALNTNMNYGNSLKWRDLVLQMSSSDTFEEYDQVIEINAGWSPYSFKQKCRNDLCDSLKEENTWKISLLMNLQDFN